MVAGRGLFAVGCCPLMCHGVPGCGAAGARARGPCWKATDAIQARAVGDLLQAEALEKRAVDASEWHLGGE